MIRASAVILIAAVAAAPAFAAEVVPLPHFTGVGLSGGGNVVIKYGATQSVTLVKGSTQYTRFKVENGGGLEIDACNSDCPEHYDLQIEIITPDLNAVAIAGGGTIEAQGEFPSGKTLNVAIAGGGDIDARAVKAAVVKAAVNGGGEMKVAASGTLKAAVSGGGEITYWGNPQVVQAISGGGEVERGE